MLRGTGFSPSYFHLVVLQLLGFLIFGGLLLLALILREYIQSLPTGTGDVGYCDERADPVSPLIPYCRRLP